MMESILLIYDEHEKYFKWLSHIPRGWKGGAMKSILYTNFKNALADVWYYHERNGLPIVIRHPEHEDVVVESASGHLQAMLMFGFSETEK